MVQVKPVKRSPRSNEVAVGEVLSSCMETNTCWLIPTGFGATIVKRYVVQVLRMGLEVLSPTALAGSAVAMSPVAVSIRTKAIVESVLFRLIFSLFPKNLYAIFILSLSPKFVRKLF